MTIHPTTEIMPLETDSHGVIHVGKTRVTLESVILSFLDGSTAEEIAQQYPSLKLADVYSVIGYYLRNQTEVDAYLKQRKQQADETRKQNESRLDPVGIRERLAGRRAGGKS
jgi:uncharacterized protein (DUF433 family)